MMETELRTFIRSASGVANTQWEMAVEDSANVNPLITIVLVSDTPSYTIDKMVDLRDALIQIDVWTDDLLQGITIREAIVAASEDFSSEHIVSIDVSQIRSGKDVRADTVYRQSIDLRVNYTR